MILHIGWRKTGTSAIQQLLYNNRDLLRARHSINYPLAGLSGRAHHLAGWKLLGKQPPRWLKIDKDSPKWRAAGFQDMVAETESANCSAMVVSSEALSVRNPGFPDRLARELEGRAVEIIGYVRRQDRYVEARYNQHVKSGRPTPELPQFVADHLDDLDYHQHFTRWASAFGKENVRVRIYERSGFRQGDVRRDFLDLLGIGDGGLVFEEGLLNASLTFSGVQFLRRLNPGLPEGVQRRRVVHLLEQYAREHPDHSSLLMPEERRALLERFGESNRKFAREFLGRDEAFAVPPEELAREAKLDMSFGEPKFLAMLAFVLPRLLQWRPSRRPRPQP